MSRWLTPQIIQSKGKQHDYSGKWTGAFPEERRTCELVIASLYRAIKRGVE
ncbi:TPA: hypothetical protein U2M51_003777 [Providencia rettgeri]|nr:hypothetical protein [Providencia rettgeri]